LKKGAKCETLMLPAVFCGDDSIKENQQVVQACQTFIKRVLDIDISKVQYFCQTDGKGYRIRKENSNLFPQISMFGEFHFEENLLEAFVDRFYDTALKQLAQNLNISKSFKNMKAKEVKKVRSIVSILTLFCFQQLHNRFPNKKITEIFEICLDLMRNKRKDRDSQHPTIGVSDCNFEHLLFWADCKKEDLLKESDLMKLKISKIASNAEISGSLIKKKLQEEQKSPEFPIVDDFLEERTSKQLRTLLWLVNPDLKSKMNDKKVIETLKDSALKFELDENSHEIISLFTLAHFGSCCYGYHVATRTKNWRLRMFIIKQSIRLFHNSGKNKYAELCLYHLRDLMRMSADNLRFLKKIWVIPSETSNSYVGIDEVNEFFNGYLKSHVTNVSKNTITFYSTNHFFIKLLDQQWKNLFEAVDEEDDDCYKYHPTGNLTKDLQLLKNSDIHKIKITQNVLFALQNPVPSEEIEKKLK